MRNTKIVCTIGPACDKKEILLQMIDAGMNVARFNLSHATYPELQARVAILKEAMAESGKPVAILLDTKGPEIRIGSFSGGKVQLESGQDFSLLRCCEEGCESQVGLAYPRLIDLLNQDPQSVGRHLLLDDGKIDLEVRALEQDAIRCTVCQGGQLGSRKSINLPGYPVAMPFISQADRSDIEFGLNLGVTYLAASFVRTADDVRMMRDFLGSLGHDEVEIIAKIENQSGMDHLDEIIAASDGVMVARGDMGVEIPFIQLPAIQKQIIRKCVSAGKYVITATQMLESMTASPRPTRAEVSDVANAVYDGTSAVMLSGESAAGNFPVESVRAMAAICQEAESTDYVLRDFATEDTKAAPSFRDTICMAAMEAARRLDARAIIVESQTGRVARAMSHYRPGCPIIAVVTSQAVQMKLTLNWGITAVLGQHLTDSDSITQQAMEKALCTGIVQKGDTVIVISSNHAHPSSGTDTLNIRVV